MFEFPESGGWLTDARLITPRGVREGAVRVVRGRIAAVAQRAPRGAAVQRLRGAWLAPGLIDLHVWGDPEAVSRDAVRQGTTSFLTTLGPAAQMELARQVRARTGVGPLAGALAARSASVFGVAALLVLIARGQVVRPGRTLTVTRAEVAVVKDGKEKPCAAMQQTMMRIVGRADVIG